MTVPLDAVALTRAYADGSLTPLEVARESLQRAVFATDRYAAMASIDVEGTMAAAAASTRRWERQAPLGPLDGVPISFKDSFHVAGLPRWHGTSVSPGPVSSSDAAPVRRAREAGMLVVGKTTMPDYAMLMSGLSSQHGTIGNPWGADLNPAGSSAGAGASVLAGAAAVAVGTDMIGSVRIPAAVCALASLKPTQGRIAYDPAGHHRSAGAMARTVDDVELALEVLGQHDDADLYALPGRYLRPASPPDDLTGVRVGVLRSLSWGAAVDADTAATLEQGVSLLAASGAELVEVPDLPVDAGDHDAMAEFALDLALPDYLAATPAERGRVLPAVGFLLERSFCRTAVDVAASAHRLAAAVERVRRALDGLDFVLSPVLPVAQFPAGALSPDPGDAFSHMGFACWFNRLGRPAGTVPVRSLGPGRCPGSVQVAGRRFDDAGVLAVLRRLEQVRGFRVEPPPMDLELPS